MNNNLFSEISSEALLKRRNLLKGVLIGFGIIVFFIFAFTIFVLITKGFNKTPIVTFTPIFLLPVTFSPFLIYFVLINKEVKLRNL